MTRTFLHGTTYENAMTIINNQKFNNNDIETVWTCSNPDLLYLRDADTDEATWQTVESAQLAAAYLNSQSQQIAIIQLKMSDELADEIIENDMSCPDTDGCFQLDKEELDFHIANGNIQCQVLFYNNAYIPYLRPFYLTSICTKYMSFKDKTLEYAIQILNKNSIFIDELYEYGDVDRIIDIKPIQRKAV